MIGFIGVSLCIQTGVKVNIVVNRDAKVVETVL